MRYNDMKKDKEKKVVTNFKDLDISHQEAISILRDALFKLGKVMQKVTTNEILSGIHKENTKPLVSKSLRNSLKKLGCLIITTTKEAFEFTLTNNKGA